MRFTIVSHACLYVEHGDVRLLVDPWLVGTAYWRSWANLPEPSRALVDSLDPTAIYLTHCHWDHCHGPSLRRFDPDVPVYIADAPSWRLQRDLEGMGRRDVRRIPHGTSVRLGESLALWSWQFGIAPVDSACGIRPLDGSWPALLDLNDCKVYGPPFARLLRQFGRPNIVLRAHTSATAIPYCIQPSDGGAFDWPALRPPEHYRAEWWACVRATGAEIGVPFASNHAFVHPETVCYNRTAMSSLQMSLASADPDGPRCWVLAPGSTWNPVDGFKPVAWDAARAGADIERLVGEYRSTALREDAVAAADPANLEAVPAMCVDLLRRVPLVARWFLPRTTLSSGSQSWTICWRRGRVIFGPAAAPLLLQVHPRVLGHAARNRIGGHLGPSKRVSIRLAGTQPTLFQLRLLFFCWEMADSDLLPLWSNLRPSRLRRWLRRWRELLAAVQLLCFRPSSARGFAALWSGSSRPSADS